MLFPLGATNLTNTNDLAAFTSFVSLVFNGNGNGNGYALNGNAIVLTHSIAATAGSTTINLPINVSNNAVTVDANDANLRAQPMPSGRGKRPATDPESTDASRDDRTPDERRRARSGGHQK